MKIHLTLSGTFHRTPINLAPSKSVTLEQWMQSFQAVATQVRQRSPQRLRQQFGLNFLSESILIQLLQQAHQTEEIKALYQIPALQWLQPINVSVEQTIPTLYQYHFISSQAQIELQPDDLQIPSHWQSGEISQTGVYQIILKDNSSYPGLSETWLNSLWQQVQKVWQNYSPLEKIAMALQSTNTDRFSFQLSEHPGVKVSVENSELALDIKEAIVYLRQPQTDLSYLSTPTQTLIQKYQESGNLPLSYFQFPEDLKIESSIDAHHQFIIGKGKSRRAIENLINQAQQFLLVSSYIIEDEFITELICQKAATLPQGVWILTTLRDEVIDRLDTQVENRTNSLEVYQRTDERKAKCLTMLLEAGARIRGGAFHLKTYLSEKAAYLGSCNLTGGSLDFNLEGGLICQGTSTYQNLRQYFAHCWHYKTEYDVLPSSLTEQFIQRTLKHSFSAFQFRDQTLLTASQYRKDLQQELSQFMGEVEIYSRGFSTDVEILSLLKTRSTHVYFEAFTSCKESRIKKCFLPDIHAKITLLGERVAYIGGINFQFDSPEINLIDLMYKTKNRQEINQIRQQLSASFF